LPEARQARHGGSVISSQLCLLDSNSYDTPRAQITIGATQQGVHTAVLDTNTKVD
jgi:hypothetical protein